MKKPKIPWISVIVILLIIIIVYGWVAFAFGWTHIPATIGLVLLILITLIRMVFYDDPLD